MTALLSPQQASVTAPLQYLEPGGVRPRVRMHPLADPSLRESCTFRSQAISIEDGRPLAHAMHLDWNGFQLIHQSSAVTAWGDAAHVREVHYPEIEALVRRLLPAKEVVVFDHAVRRRGAASRPLDLGRDQPSGDLGPVGRVHVDYTEASGPRRFLEVFGRQPPSGEAYCILNLWRPLVRPLEDAPLALGDARTFSPEDLVTTDLEYASRTGEFYLVRHRAGQRWYWFPRMTPEEVLVFKSYDSRLDGRARFTAHSAFENPLAGPDAPRRQSIEVRCLVRLGSPCTRVNGRRP